MNKRLGIAGWVAGLTLGFLMLNTTVAYAYIDPGSGSMLFQILVGVLLASAVAVKAFWRRIIGLFSRRSKNSERLP